MCVCVCVCVCVCLCGLLASEPADGIAMYNSAGPAAQVSQLKLRRASIHADT